MTMKKSYSAAVLPLAAILLMMAALALNIASPGTPAYAQSNSNLAPNEDGPWLNPPVNVSRSTLYDNTADIGASKIDGAVTVGWERRNEAGGNENLIMQASNTALDAPFLTQSAIKTDLKASGNVRVAGDGLGRRHMIWWAASGATCGYYARIERDGRISVNEQVPGTCATNRKNTAIAVGPDNTVHALFGQNNENIYYYKMETNGAWSVAGEKVPNTARPGDLALEVNGVGQAMAAWKDIGLSGSGSDIYTALRLGPSNWRVEDISNECCTGCNTYSKAYLPSLARSPDGGLRASWSDEKCDPQSDPNLNDIYYREWMPTTGWNNQPLVRVVNNAGHSYNNEIAVDSSGRAHIIWQDTTGRQFGNFRVFYTSGFGTVFAASEAPFDSWGGGSYQKEVGIDDSPGYVHVSFGSNRDDSQKENYYSRKQVGAFVPPPPTSTPTPIASPTSTTRCPGQRFSDVCPGDFFYVATLALNDAGIINGYNTVPPCDNAASVPCFKPYNNVTRGQVSKMVSEARDYREDPGVQRFADVPPLDTFYVWIQRLAARGIIGGYPCSTQAGTTEPCVAPTNLPYFRPGNNLTRSQLAIIVSRAFGFSEAPGAQRFADVVPGSNAYEFVQRLANRGIIGGYPCSTQVGTTEPCGPGNLPYYRPNNDVTRGQTAKIIYEALQTVAPPTPTVTATATRTSTPVPTP